MSRVNYEVRGINGVPIPIPIAYRDLEEALQAGTEEKMSRIRAREFITNALNDPDVWYMVNGVEFRRTKIPVFLKKQAD